MRNTFYFDHDYNSRNDSKILEIRSEFGWSGYGLFFAILETMAESKGYIQRGALGGLSVGLSHPKDQLIIFIDFCIKIGIFLENENGIYSKRILSHLEFREMLSKSGRSGGLKNKGKQSPPSSTPKSENKAPLQAPLEASKVKESKEKKIKRESEEKNIDFKNLKPETWERWLRFKKEQHKFTFKSKESEQVGINLLIKYSSNNDDKANKIIDQSMANGWSGLFELKDNDNKKFTSTGERKLAY